MALFESHPTIDDFNSIDWQAPIRAVEDKTCDAFTQSFADAFGEAKVEGLNQHCSVFGFLNGLCSMYMTEDLETPLKAAMEFANGNRTKNLSDIDDVDIEILQKILPLSEDPEFIARVADVLWIKVKDFRAAKIAVDFYLESVRRIAQNGSWPIFMNRLRRALAIARMLGSKKVEKNTELQKVLECIEQLATASFTEDSRFLNAALMGMLQDAKLGELSIWSDRARQAIKKAEEEEQWHCFRIYSDHLAKYLDRMGNSELARQVRLDAAETYVREANTAMTSGMPSHLRAAALLESAIEAFRQVGGVRERINALRIQLASHQRLSIDEAFTSETSIDVTSLVKLGQETVSSLSFIDALGNLATLPLVRSQDFVENEARSHLGEGGLQEHIDIRIHGKNQRVIAVRPPLISDDPKKSKEAIRIEAIRESKEYFCMMGGTCIEAALQRIRQEHPEPDTTKLLEILSLNSFVSAGRVQIYLRGLMAGLQGDYLLAMHLLIPQMENSIRHELEAVGKIVSTYHDDGLEAEKNLRQLLFDSDSDFAAVFGQAMAFNLQGLFVEKVGPNLRNELAHGLLEESDFNASCCAFAWWIIWLLCWLGHGRDPRLRGAK